MIHDRRRRTTDIGDVVSLSRAVAALSLWLIAVSALAQNQPETHDHAADSPAPATWSWTSDANVFVGYNYQQRLFADTSAWESQNWFMAAGSRQLGGGRLTLQTMLSLEPFTSENSCTWADAVFPPADRHNCFRPGRVIRDRRS